MNVHPFHESISVISDPKAVTDGRNFLPQLHRDHAASCALIIDCVYDVTKSYISEFSGQLGGVVRIATGASPGHLRLGLRALRELAGRFLKGGKRHPVSLSEKA
jgi:hypothetical protein